MPSPPTRTSPEQLYRLLADNATDVVTLHDIEGRYLYVSPSIRTFGGYAPEDLIGRSCWALIHPDDIPAVQTAIADAILKGGIVTLEYRLRDADGHYEWIETTARSVGDEIQCSSRKVTERRVAQAQQAAVARLGDLVMLRPNVDEVLDEATRMVAETLEVELVGIVEHDDDGIDRLRAGVGWDDGIVGSEYRPQALSDHRVASSATVIVGRPEDPMGVLRAHTRTSRPFHDSDALGCDHAQGFLLSKPLPAEALEDLLRGDG